MREISDEPRNVREILVELTDSSEFAVDLAYSAVRDDRLTAGDVIVGRGSRAGIETVYRRATGETLVVRGPPAGVDQLRAVAGDSDDERSRALKK